MKSILKRCTLTCLLALFCSLGYAQIELCAIPVENSGQIELQVKTTNFDDIVSFQFGVAWSINKFDLVAITNFNTELMDYDDSKFSPVFENVPDQINLIRTLWLDPQLVGVSLEDEAVLFSVILEPTSSEPSTNFGIVPDSQFAIEVINTAFEELVVGLDNCATLAPFDISTSTSNVEQVHFSISPNPVQNVLSVQFKSITSGAFEVYNLSGQLISGRSFVDTIIFEEDFSEILPGTYFIKFLDTEGKLNGSSLLVKK